MRFLTTTTRDALRKSVNGERAQLRARQWTREDERIARGFATFRLTCAGRKLFFSPSFNSRHVTIRKGINMGASRPRRHVSRHRPLRDLSALRAIRAACE